MKKILAMLVVGLTIVLTGVLAYAQEFSIIKIKCENLEKPFYTKARFKDTKQPINLSDYYSGYVWATVPSYNAEREIEAFLPDEITFTDNDDSRYEFYVMKELAQSGVILGNEKGEAKPFDNVTRAEGTAMVMRFLGLEPQKDYAETFEDVSKDDWYFATVALASEAGIVMGDSENEFSPNRNVTREEITVMVARAIKYANLGYTKNYVMPATDVDMISDWAKEAYEIIGGNYVSDYDDTDPENPKRVLNPQKAATRYDIAYMLSNVTSLCQVYPSEAATIFGFDEIMPVIDGSTSTYPFTQSVYGALFSNGSSHQMYPSSHSKSHASYQHLINGEVDMLFASVYPAGDILEMAESKGVELELIPIAYDAMIFFTNMDNPITGITKEQITNIYVNNKYENWSELGGNDALIYPYCRNYDSGSHAQMEKHFLNGNDIHEKIRQETTSVSMSNVLTDVMEAKTNQPLGFGLGYSIYYYFNNMDMFYNTKSELKLLEIDGVYPNDETIASGKYPLSNNTYVVLRKDEPEGSPARKMAEFMLTEAGQICVENAGYGRLK